MTSVTPPHFFVTDNRSAHLNLALAEETLAAAGRPTRSTVILGSRYPLEAVEALAKDFAAAGITRVELRLSPFGGEELSVRQVRGGFARAQLFTTAGIEVTLGWSGIVGQTAMSRGIDQHYSVGIGLLEQVNHAAVINRQQQPPKPASPDGTASRQGPVSGIYLPALALTVGRRVGAALLADTDIRTRIGCRTGACGTTIKGPTTDPRTHYLHAHAGQAAELLAQPAPGGPRPKTTGHDANPYAYAYAGHDPINNTEAITSGIDVAHVISDPEGGDYDDVRRKLVVTFVTDGVGAVCERTRIRRTGTGGGALAASGPCLGAGAAAGAYVRDKKEVDQAVTPCER